MVDEAQLEQLADAIAKLVFVKLEQMQSRDRIVDIKELSVVSKLSIPTIYRAIKAGRLTGEKLGGALRFNLQIALAQISAAGELLTIPARRASEEKNKRSVAMKAMRDRPQEKTARILLLIDQIANFKQPRTAAEIFDFVHASYGCRRTLMRDLGLLDSLNLIDRTEVTRATGIDQPIDAYSIASSERDQRLKKVAADFATTELATPGL